MKIYAKQVAPEYQESPLFLDDDFFPDNIAVCGNRQYKERCPDIFTKINAVLENGECAEILESKSEWARWYKNITAVIMDYLPPEHKSKYATKEIHELKRLVLSYPYCKRIEEDTILCEVLSIVTGKKWSYKQICGCCQSEWNYIYYPAEEWSREALEAFEAEYFNTGSEWIIDDGDFDPENDSPLNINGYSVYCVSWRNEDIRKEIADASGESPEDVILYAFTGYSKTAQYSKVI